MSEEENKVDTALDVLFPPPEPEDDSLITRRSTSEERAEMVAQTAAEEADLSRALTTQELVKLGMVGKIIAIGGGATGSTTAADARKVLSASLKCLACDSQKNIEISNLVKAGKSVTFTHCVGSPSCYSEAEQVAVSQLPAS